VVSETRRVPGIAVVVSMRASRTASLEDGEVVRRVLGGETALFEVLVRRHEARVYRAVRSILRDEDETEDAVQQAWLQAYLHLGEFEAAAALSTWLVRIAMNEALMRLRRSSRLVRIPDAIEEQTIDHSTGDPEDRLAARETARFVERAVQRLPVPYRSAFLLSQVEGLSTAETANALSIGEQATKMRLHRARAMLRRALAEATGHGILELSTRTKAVVVLTDLDVARLRGFVARHRAEIDRACAERVAARLKAATIVLSREVPREIVTMNSRVLLEGPGVGPRELALVYSPEADPSSGRISVFSRLGAGVLGRSAGERIDSAKGTTGAPVRIVSIPYQPEAAGHFDL
jgi:RNA polymerase sigma-70 factor (ECF subfamily)